MLTKVVLYLRLWNLLVIKSRRLHTITHVLLANLAIADLMIATINIPFSASRVILKEWPFGNLICRIVPSIQIASVYSISYTMSVIALDRYRVIMNPLRRRLKSIEGIPLVIGIWILSIFFSIPYALHHQVVNTLSMGVVKRCQANFDSLQKRQLLTVGTFFLQYLIPLVVTTVSYTVIMRKLNSREAVLGSRTVRQVEAQSRARMKTIKMLVLTVICFGVSWAPINTYHLLTHFGFVRHNSTAILISHIIAMSSSCYNPYIYCWLNEHFRQEALKWSRCFRSPSSIIVRTGFEVNGTLTRAEPTFPNQSSSIIHQNNLPSTSTSLRITNPINTFPISTSTNHDLICNSQSPTESDTVTFANYKIHGIPSSLMMNPSCIDGVTSQSQSPEQSLKNGNKENVSSPNNVTDPGLQLHLIKRNDGKQRYVNGDPV